MTDTIQCPNCGHNFALNEALMEQFEEEKQQAVYQAINIIKGKTEEEKTQLIKEFAEEREELQKKIQIQAQKDAQREFQLKLKEKDEELERIRKQLKDLERRTQQGSMEIQGEALESYLKELLERTFPYDTISDVKKGQSGADFIHEVINRNGQRSGRIVWEAKNTKNWNNDWLAKIKENAAHSNAELKVIVSIALPNGITTFDLIDDVWVSTIEAAPALARVLRENLLHLSNVKRAMEGQNGKMEQVYFYLTSTLFRDRVQRIVETWQALKNQIDAEERAMAKQWKERRKQLDIMIDVTTDMYTDVSAIIGEMPRVEGLTLNALPSSEDLEEL